ncbi:MAG TPA: AI-2E family transporter [Thermoanaerobaculia bacterium]|nr:AI-2E family transporter [Thermoanaerobaculia bacterium]
MPKESPIHLEHRAPDPPDTREEEEHLPEPDIHKLGDSLRSPAGRSLAMTGLFVLASFYTLYFCRSLLLPLVLALLLSLLLSPVVRGLRKLHIPGPLGAGLVILALLGGVGFGIYELSGPASDWMQRAPQSMRAAEVKLRDLKRSVQKLGRATEQVERIADVSSAPGPGQRVPVVAVSVASSPTLRERLFSQAADLVTDAVVMLILLFFLLASGDLFLRKLIRVLPRLEDKRRAVEIASQVERDMSGYLSTLTVINLALGAAVALVFALIKVPNPLLWGAMVACTNFVPYLGPAINYGVFAVLGLLTFDTVPRMLLPVGLFLVLNVLESYVISPLVLGKRLTLNPVVLFVSLTFWGWMWGIVGAILAVPIMVVFKIFCDHLEPLAPIGEFLGD